MSDLSSSSRLRLFYMLSSDSLSLFFVLKTIETFSKKYMFLTGANKVIYVFTSCFCNCENAISFYNVTRHWYTRISLYYL